MKKLGRFTIFLFTLFLPFSGKASLADDTSKVVALNDLASEISNSNTDSAILVSKQALRLAQKIKWEEGIAKSMHFLDLFYSSKGDNKIALDYYFKALDIWEKQEANTGAINTIATTEWNLFPNPTNGALNITTTAELNSDVIVEVYAADGKLIRSENKQQSKTISVDISAEPVGVYFIRITTNDKTTMHRVVKI